MIGVIAGTGINSLVAGREDFVDTPFGQVVEVRGKVGGRDAIFINRHGLNHVVPPHKVVFKSIVYELKRRGCSVAVGVCSSGIISGYSPGDLVLLDDFIGLGLKPTTYFDSFEAGVRHVDLSEPYSLKACDLLKRAAKKANVKLKTGGIVATVPGPRLETPAEIRALKTLGANLVSMTASFEAILAKELELPYACIAVGANYACGVKGVKKLSFEEIEKETKKQEEKVKKIIFEAVKLEK
ncbi:MTAP family purine nucleoside phosphorylase [Candidatus Micrarchaeota archaeon]|nr:MTAP family purine nucleoside phosphorylase [Candidatus Micrarchaeota archaeon]